MSRKTRKLMWSVPLIAAVAVIGALAAFVVLTPNSALAQQQEVVPGAPTELMLRALDQTTIELKWTAPSDDAGGVPDGYRIDYSADGMVWYSLVANQSGTKYVDNKDLEASEERHYRVFAFNTAGTSEMLGPSMITTTASTKPDAPTALVVTHGDATTNYADKEHLIVAWTPPVDPPGAPVTSYRITVSKNGSSFDDLEKELKVKDASCSGTGAARRCQYTHKGLFENTERWYRIYAMNAVAESLGSERRSGTTAKGNIPEEPENLRVGITTAGEMRLYWDRPSTAPIDGATHNPPGAPITGYYIVGGPVAPASTAVTAEDGLTLRKLNAAGDALEDFDIGTADNAPSLDHVVFHSQGTERALNTGSELATLANLAGRASPGHATLPTHWGFQVMSVNRVVERNVQNGRKIETHDANALDGKWSSSIRVNDTANQTGMLASPTVEADRHSGSNDGRTGIRLDWSVTGTTTAYRVEYSEDRIDWKALTGADASVFAGFDGTGTFTPTTAPGATETSGVHQGIVAGTSYSYRVFAQQPTGTGAPDESILTQSSAAVSETTATPDRPHTPTLSSVSPVSETELSMTVLLEESIAVETTNPIIGAESGDAEVGFGKLVGYRIEISDDGRDWSKYTPVEIGPDMEVRYSYSEKDMKLTESDGPPAPTADAGNVQFRYTGLHQKATRHFRASTINNAPGTLKYSVPAPVVMGTTNESLASDDPGGLVAKAKDRNNIELVWYARGDHITAAPVTGYKIDHSPLNDDGDCAGDWSTLVEDTESTDTSYTHMDLMPGTGYCYRVFGINVVDVSTSFIGFGDAYVSTYDADAQATTDPAVAPMMPTAVTAAVVDDMQINVSWMAPADDGGSDILGYVLQRKSDGDYMTIAASNAASWWNALDCPMMNDAIPADATPPPGADDSSSPYCKLYDYLAEDAKEEVDAAYMALGHGTISDTSYMNVGLMDMTAYTYRVKAVNAKGASGWAESNTATTDTSVTVPSIVLNVEANATSDTEVTVTWDPPADDGGSPITGYMIIYRVDGAAESTNMEMAATGTSATISGLMANTTYRIWVTATNAIGDGDGKGQTTVTTQMAPVELTKPIITLANPVGSSSVGVDWTTVPGATSYVLYAVHLEDGDITARDVPPGQTSFSVSGLNVGEDYLIFVGVFSGAANYKLSDPYRVTVE